MRATRVVLCSAIYRGTVGTDTQAAFGADAFVEKPFRLDELTRVFKVALLGPLAAETSEERVAREEATGLWRAAAEALTADRPGQASGWRGRRWPRTPGRRRRTSTSGIRS